MDGFLANETARNIVCFIAAVLTTLAVIGVYEYRHRTKPYPKYGIATRSQWILAIGLALLAALTLDAGLMIYFGFRFFSGLNL